MKTLAALALVLMCAACAPAGNSTPNRSFDDGIANQENRTALSLFYGDYTVVSQNGETIAGTDGSLTCSTDAAIANSVAAYPISGGGGDYAMNTFTDANGEVVKSDDVWISPGVLYYSNAPACSDFHMYVFEDRGKWRMGKDFVEYTFDGTLTRNDGQQVTFDSSLRADRLSDGQVQVQMHSKTSEGGFSGTWVLAPR